MSSVTEYLFNSIYNVLKQKQKRMYAPFALVVDYSNRRHFTLSFDYVSVTDDLLNDLYGLFGDQLCDALALLDNAQEHLAKLCSPCELNIWRVKCVKKKKETFVYCLPNGNYCSCPDFAIDGIYICDDQLTPI